MSDTSEELAKDRSSDGAHDNFCRDFVRGMCERKFCKYKHEQDTKTLNFCHDFQNTACPRPACKFIHCTAQEVEHYKRTGEMSNQILAEATRKNQLPGTMPICNSFRKGMCRRPFCKYRHISKADEDAEILEILKNNSSMKHPLQNNNLIIIDDAEHKSFLLNLRRPYHFEESDEFCPTNCKRRFIANGLDSSDLLQTEINRRNFKGYFASNPPAPVLSRMDARTLILEEENNLMQKEIAQLKKQVSDLTATNEFLLDQNATLRCTGNRNGTVTVPAVTITNTLPQSNQGQVIRTVAASVATVPVSLATVTTCNPVSGSVSIAGCPAVSIAPATQILAPSQQILVTTNQPTQLALANSSQAQLAIAQQNLANNLAQPQLTSQAQQLALATTTQQLTSQAQHIANQQIALATAPQQITSQSPQLLNNSQQLALATSQQSHLNSQVQQLGQQLTSQAQQLNQQLTSQAQQLALANTTQQLTSQAQQLALANTALANTTQQLTSQAQQLALANTPQQLAVANVSQQLALASTNQQLLAQQNQQIELHRSTQINAINTSQTIAMSNASTPMVSYPIMTHALPH